MRKLMLVAFCLLVFGSAAMAQNKIEHKWKCSAPAKNYSFDVGDVADHKYAIMQGTCDATSGSSGEKTATYTEFQEIWKTSYMHHGRFNVTLDSGDKVYYTYEGTEPTDPKKPLSDKWKIVSGTGKQKGIKGSGTCTGKQNEDGSSDWTCTGTSTMGK